MLEENEKKSGFSCFGFGCGFLFAGILVLVVIGLSVFGAIGYLSRLSLPERLAYDDPDSFEEEYICGQRGSDSADFLSKIAVIDIKGVIVSDMMSSFSEGVDARSVCARIRRASEDDQVKALIVNLDTPGGEVAASDEIYEELRLFRETTKKPAVAMMNSMAASGGYYVASGCKPIIANKLTLTGSIGVIISTYNYRGLFEKIGVKSEVYTSGKMKDMLDGSRERTPEEIALVQTLVNNTYGEFVNIVSRSRNIPAEKIRGSVIGDGRVFDGKQALSLGLVDSLGYFRDAVAAAAKAAHLEKGSFTVIRYQEPFSFSKFLSMLFVKTHPVNISVQGQPFKAFTPKRGMLYFLPADL